LKNFIPSKLLTNKEAAELLTKALEQFKDKEGNVDVDKAVLAIFNDPKPLRHNKKAVEQAIVAPQACYHYYHLWEWLGLRLVKAFKHTSD
jgi:hypothetical protein